MSVTRIHEDPRVTKPYSEDQWQRIDRVGREVDARLQRGDVRLTMGGEPTFVSIDDQEGAEWNTAAVGPAKQRLSDQLLRRLRERFAPGALLHFGQGKWYPGESLPRWALRCYWRMDGEPMWRNESLLADPLLGGLFSIEDARRFGQLLAERLGVNPQHVIDGFEDAMYYAWRERRLPRNVDVRNSRLENEEERARLARVFEQGITAPVGCALPLRRIWWEHPPRWESGEWIVRSDEMFLVPGDSPMGFRLPIQSLLWQERSALEAAGYARDAFADRPVLPRYHQLRERAAALAGQAPRPVRQFAWTGAGADELSGAGDSYGAERENGAAEPGANGVDGFSTHRSPPVGG